MKYLIFILISLLGASIQAQSWFDDSCKSIDDNVTTDEFKLLEPRNILKITVNQAGDLELNGVEKTNLSEIRFKEFILDFVTNPNGKKDKAIKPEKVIFQISSFLKDSKETQKFTNYIYDVYLYLWDKESGEKYNSTYIDLNCKKREKVFKNYPLKIINESSSQKKKKSVKRKGLGLPEFGGDTTNN